MAMANGRGAEECDDEPEDPVVAARREVAAEYLRSRYNMELTDPDLPDNLLDEALAYAEREVSAPWKDAPRRP